MSCTWEGRILQYLDGAPDPEAGAHLRECPGCAALAAELAADAQRLRRPPPEAAEVDYAALRLAARRGAERIRWRRRVWVGLAVAAALLLAWRLPVGRPVPQTARETPFHRPPVVTPRALPETAHAPAAAMRRHRRARPDAIDRQFAEFLRAQEQARHPVPPAAETTPLVRIATSNPNVIIWLQEGEEQ